ncbi:heme ABC transporter ATP-binding protein, partial [Acinetobacter baumannii]
ITHKFREVMAFADEVSVLRRGKLVGGGLVTDLDTDRMAAMMVGEAALPQPKSRNEQPAGAVRLRVDSISALDDGGQPAVRGLTLEVRAGEIL